jgi:ADP-ribose pyrophosphatase YjhB (NUDIX family)
LQPGLRFCRPPARRSGHQKAGIATPYLEQLQGFGDGTRDPRGWTATFAYFALVASDELVLAEGGNAEAVAWHPVPGERRLASNRPAQIYRVKPGRGTVFFDRVI